MRALDRAIPVIGLDAVEQISHWPVRPVIALQGSDVVTVFDESEWDAAVWDSHWKDATCSWTGLEIEHAENDTVGLFPASRCLVQLDNSDGQWSSFNADGTSSSFGPGQTLSVWATDYTDEWWLFSGRIARWDQRADDTVEIEAFDSFSDLNQPIGKYTPGVNGQRLSARLTAVLAAAGESAMPHRFDTGSVLLTAQESENSPLEEMQVVSQSDGGLLFVDADGTLLGLDRLWRSGRTDQEAIPIASDNVATVPICVWDAVLSTNDLGLADTILLTNIAELHANAGTLSAGGYVIALVDQQWTTQIEGDILADMLLTEHSQRQVNIEEFALYLLDPNQPELWKAVDWRRLDSLRFIHDQKAVGGLLRRIDVTTLINQIAHEITPSNWVMTVGTAKAYAFHPPILYDTGVVYDDTPPEEYEF